MALSKAAGSWAELQESFNRVRQQYDLFPPAGGWTSLAALDAQENAAFGTHRKKTTSTPLLPNLSQDVSNVQIRKGNKQHTEGFLRNQHDRDLRLKLPPVHVTKSCTSLGTQKDNLAVLKTGFAKRSIQSGIVQTSLDLGPLKYFTENRNFASNFVDSLMSEILVGEIVPDVLMEALTDSTLQVWQQLKKSYYIAATKDEKLEAVLDWDSLSLMDEIITEVVKDLSVPVIRRTVRGFVDYHLLTSAVGDFIDEIIISIMQTELPSMIQEINDEIHLNDMLQNLIDNVIDKEVKNTVIIVLGELEAQRCTLQENQISASAIKYLVDTFLLEHLLGMIGGNQSVTFVKDASPCLLDSMMLDILLRQQLRIVRGRQVTLENRSMKIVHQKAFSAVALDVIMTELSMVIDEDMEDIFEYERDIAFGGY